MKREKIRLRPTGLWLLFGPILGCMWLAAVNYSNNLVYGILYLIGSLTFVSIFHTWRNIAALEVEYLRVHPAFAGGEVRVEVHLRNSMGHPVYGLFLSRLDESRRTRKAIPLLFREGTLRIDAMDTRAVDLFFSARRRGRFQLNSLLIRSSYPFGLIWASFCLVVETDYFVYPEPQGNILLPKLQAHDGIQSSARPGDDFGGVRNYAPGESLRHVDWKAYARGRPLAVKQFVGGDEHELWLDGAALADLPLEERLSQLAQWVVMAEKEDVPYALKWGNTVIPHGLGAEQARRVLQVLAVAGQD